MRIRSIGVVGAGIVTLAAMGPFSANCAYRITEDGAEAIEHAIGIDNLGTLEPGMPADIMVYDQAALKLTTDQPFYETILGGGKRLIEKAEGYRYMLVNGVVTFEDGICTGALPGRVLRTAAYVPEQV